jgi:hypothetical protein
MKILIIQENGHHEENRAFRECFCMLRSLEKLGCNVDIWGLGHKNYPETPDWNSYDLIINLENYDLSGWVPSLSSTTGPKKFLWVIDAHCRGMESYTKTYTEGGYDLVLQAIEDYVDANSIWFPNCYDDSLIRPTQEKEVFLGFCGSILNRAPVLDFLTEKYGLRQDIWVLGEKMVDTVSSYDVQFNVNLANDINYRSFETLGCGTLLLTNYNPQYEKLGFVDGENCLMYHDPSTLCEKIEYCQNNPAEVRRISIEGQRLAKRHTYDIRAKKILSLCGSSI